MPNRIEFVEPPKERVTEAVNGRSGEIWPEDKPRPSAELGAGSDLQAGEGSHGNAGTLLGSDMEMQLPVRQSRR